MGVAERRQRERIQRRQEILEAAEEVFQAKGFAAATMEEVANAAEVSKGTLYLYFRSKDALLGEILGTYVSDAGERMRQCLIQARSGFDALGRLAREMYRFATAHPEQFCLGMGWLMPGSPDVSSAAFEIYRRGVRTLFQRHVQAIERGQQDGSVRTDLEPRRLALQLWSAVRGTILSDLNAHRLMQRIPETAEVMPLTPSFVDVLLDALRPRAPEE